MTGMKMTDICFDGGEENHDLSVMYSYVYIFMTLSVDLTFSSLWMRLHSVEWKVGWLLNDELVTT